MNKCLCRTVVECAMTSSADKFTLEAFFLFYVVDTPVAEREDTCVEWLMCLSSLKSRCCPTGDSDVTNEL